MSKGKRKRDKSLLVAAPESENLCLESSAEKGMLLNSDSPESRAELISSVKKRKKKKSSNTHESNDKGPKPGSKKLISPTVICMSPKSEETEPNVELNCSKKRRKMCKIPESTDKVPEAGSKNLCPQESSTATGMLPKSKNPEPNVELNCSKKKKKRYKIPETSYKVPEAGSENLYLQESSTASGMLPKSESPEPDVELNCSQKKKKKRSKIPVSTDKVLEPELENPCLLESSTATGMLPKSESPQPNVELNCSQKKKKKRCKIPKCTDKFPEAGSENLCLQESSTATDMLPKSENPEPNVELNCSKQKKKKRCKIPESSDKVLEAGSENLCLQESSTATGMLQKSESPEPNVELNCSRKKKEKMWKIPESSDKVPEAGYENLCLQESSTATGMLPKSEPDVELNCSKKKKKRCKIPESSDKVPEAGSENLCLQESSTATGILPKSESPKPDVELNCSQKKKKKRSKIPESGDKVPEAGSENLCLQESSTAVGMLPKSESPKPDVELNCSQKKKKKRSKIPESTDKVLQPELENPCLPESSTTICMLRESESIEPNSELYCSQTKKKEKKRSTLIPELESENLCVQESSAAICILPKSEIPEPNVELSCSQKMKKKKSCKIPKSSTEISMLPKSGSAEPNSELYCSQKKKKSCKTPGSNDRIPELESENPCLQKSSTEICIIPDSEAVEPNSELNCTKRTKKRKVKKVGKTPESNDVIPEPGSENICMQGSSTEMKEKRKRRRKTKDRKELSEERMMPEENSSHPLELVLALPSCSTDMKEKSRKRRRKTKDSKELSEERMMPEDNSSHPLKLVLALPSCSTDIKEKNRKRRCKTKDSKELSEERMMPEENSSHPLELVLALPSCSTDIKEKNRKRRCKTKDSKELSEERMMPEENSSHPLEVVLALPSCSTEMKEKNQNRGLKTKDSKDLSEERMMPEENSSHLLELVPSCSTEMKEYNRKRRRKSKDSKELSVERKMSEENSSHLLELVVALPSSTEMKENNRKRRRRTKDSKELSEERMMLEENSSHQPPLVIASKQELEVALPLVEGMSKLTNSVCLEPNADVKCSRESDWLLGEITMPEADPSIGPPLAISSEQELELAHPLNTDKEHKETLIDEVLSLLPLASKADIEPSLAISSEQELELAQPVNTDKELKETQIDEVPSLSPLASKDDVEPRHAISSEQELELAQPEQKETQIDKVPSLFPLASKAGVEPPLTISSEQVLELAQPVITDKVQKETQIDEVPSLSPLASKADVEPTLSISSEQELELAQPVNTDKEQKETQIDEVPSLLPLASKANVEPPLAISSEQELELAQPINTDKEQKATQIDEVPFLSPLASRADVEPPLALSSEQELELAQPVNTDKDQETQIDEVPSLLPLVSKADGGVVDVVKDGSLLHMPNPSTEGSVLGCSKKKLLILDINGILADILEIDSSIRKKYKPGRVISGKAVFKRPFCDDFLKFCLDRFDVGIWSSRKENNVEKVINYLMGVSKGKLKFCWNQSHCTTTRFMTLENSYKPLVLKELRKLWDNVEPGLRFAKGEYNESNTLLLDDSPYKALRNPANTAVFPYSYQFRDKSDSSLGPGGSIRSYLEGLAVAENVQKYVEENPFGQEPITNSHPSWDFYRRVIEDL